jgi:hypothetical protein
MLSLLVFNRDYRLEIQSVMLVFLTQLCELLSLSNVLSGSFPPTLPPFPKSKYCKVYTDSVYLKGNGVVLSCDGDHILQEFNLLFLTTFRTYEIA